MLRGYLVLLLTISCLLNSSLASAQTGNEESKIGCVNLPAPSGAYAVGTITYRWRDNERVEITNETGQDRREIIVQLWYPADLSSKPARASYFPLLNVALSTLRSEVNKGRLPVGMLNTFSRFENVCTNSYEGAVFTRRGRKYPVLIFSPGGNVSRHSYTILMEELASRGYVVANISHKYSVSDVFPEGLILSHSRWAGSGQLKTKEERDNFWKPLAELQAGDASFVLNKLMRLNKADADKRFTNRLDLGRIGIIGHSRGVKTVVTVLANDGRFRVGILYDNQPPMNKLNVEKHQPLLTIRPDNWTSESVSLLHAFLKRRRAVGYDVVIQGAGHMNFSDFPVVSPEGTGYKMNPNRAYQIIFDYTFSFLNKYLGNGKASLLDENRPKYPEVAVESFKPVRQTKP